MDSLPLADHTQLYRAIDLELSQTRAAYLVFCLLPALDALNTDMSSTAAAARKGADHTATLTTVKAGRASDINTEQLEGHIDPGAESVTRLFEHLAS